MTAMEEKLRNLKTNLAKRKLNNLTLFELTQHLERRVFHEAMTRLKSSSWDNIARYTGLLERTGRLDELNQVLEVLEGIENKYDRSKNLSHFASVLGRIGKEEMGRDVARRALLAIKGYYDRQGRMHALAHAASAFADLGDIKQSLDILEEIGFAYYPDSDSLARVARALTKAGRLEEALALAKQTSYPASRNNAISHIAGNLAEEGKCEEALRIVEQNTESDDFALGHIASKLAAAGRIQKAIDTIRKIRGGDKRTQACLDMADFIIGADAALLSWKCISGRVRMKNECLDGLVPGIVRALCRDGKIEEAVTIYNESQLSGGELDRAVSCIASALAASWDRKKAIAMLHLAIEKDRPSTNGRFSVTMPWQVPAYIAGSLADAGEVNEALELVHRALEIVDQTANVDTVLRVAEVLVANGEEERGKGLFVDAVQAAEGMRHEFYRLEALLEVHKTLRACSGVNSKKLVRKNNP
jgi:pentatricopeptide repeat protein